MQKAITEYESVLSKMNEAYKKEWQLDHSSPYFKKAKKAWDEHKAYMLSLSDEERYAGFLEDLRVTILNNLKSKDKEFFAEYYSSDITTLLPDIKLKKEPELFFNDKCKALQIYLKVGSRLIYISREVALWLKKEEVQKFISPQILAGQRYECTNLWAPVYKFYDYLPKRR